MQIVFVDRTGPGFTRIAQGDGFRYLSTRGKPINDPRTLKRIASLVIPPAWTNVWIAPSAGAHIQATGFDAKGRLQYRYHDHFRQTREAAKFANLVAFAGCLPQLREAVRRDMGRPGIPRERALATLVHLLEATLIRIGNSQYARDNASYGLSTLTSDHVVVEGATVGFEFTGKSGKTWKVSIRDRRAANVMRACQELPGQQLFKYLDEEGVRRGVTSSDVNAYLKLAAGRRVSAKDFRTWGGTLLCASALSKQPPGESKTALKRQIAAAIRETARALGNTPAVCRSSYVHPGVLAAHQTGDLHKHMSRAAEKAAEAAVGLKPHEEALVRLLRRLGRAQAKARDTLAAGPRRVSAVALATAP